MGPLVLLQFLFILPWPAVAASTSLMAKPLCSDTCGDITVPYPFGFGAKECYRDESFRLTCNETDSRPPKLFYSNVEVSSISVDGQMSVMSYVSQECYHPSVRQTKWNYALMNLSRETFTVSDTQNIFMVLGCDTYGLIMLTSSGSGNSYFLTGCGTICRNISVVNDNSCTGVGCCQTPIPHGFRNYYIGDFSCFENHTHGQIRNYAFLVDKNWYNFSVSNLSNFNKNMDEGYSQVPVVFDWAVDGKSCEEAMKDPTTYACGINTVCGVSKNGVGYSCNCLKGYQGNPYLPHGCQDIDECANPTKHDCVFGSKCINLRGTYKCSCPTGHHGNGKKDGNGCIKQKFPLIQVTIGTCLGGFLFLLIVSLLVLYVLLKRKDNKFKRKFFKQNGGFLLTQQLSSREGPIEAAKIYTAEELKQATKNYAQSQILGRGGYGIVYKGILPDQRIVAIKKSKIVDESQIEQFINEVVILSQINHRNVVKLLGCCLETEVPILVYEFVTNKTLFHHIHGERYNSLISWDNRLRIATETSEALAYLHSTASPPIIHRDIKSTNILLDDNYMAKVADFGASRLVPLNQTQISTLVQGTLGYLDPEYIQSSQLTEKSDVYSFGVAIVELLTGKKAVYFDGSGKEVNLAMHFITSIKEGRVWDILDYRIMIEGCKEQFQEVLKLAERCLRVKGEEKPTMKEVAIELQGLRRDQRHPWVARNPKEVECLVVEPSNLHGHKTIGYDSLTDEALMSLDGGR